MENDALYKDDDDIQSIGHGSLQLVLFSIRN